MTSVAKKKSPLFGSPYIPIWKSSLAGYDSDRRGIPCKSHPATEKLLPYVHCQSINQSIDRVYDGAYIIQKSPIKQSIRPIRYTPCHKKQHDYILDKHHSHFEDDRAPLHSWHESSRQGHFFQQCKLSGAAEDMAITKDGLSAAFFAIPLLFRLRAMLPNPPWQCCRRKSRY